MRSMIRNRISCLVHAGVIGGALLLACASAKAIPSTITYANVTYCKLATYAVIHGNCTSHAILPDDSLTFW